MSQNSLELECIAMIQLKDAIREANDPLLLSVIEKDEFLRAFLVGRKMNVKHAFDTVKGYLVTRYVKHEKVFQMKPHSVQHVLQSGFVGILKNRDHHGRVIGFVRCSRLNLETMECEDIVRSVILLCEALWSNVEDIRNGQIGILDYTGYNFSIMTRYSLTQKVTFMNVFWHNYPMMIKGVHAVNNPRIVSYAYSLLKPFIPKKVKERLIMHGDNFASLHDHVPSDILPAWLGGKLRDEEAIDTDIIKKILNPNSS